MFQRQRFLITVVGSLLFVFLFAGCMPGTATQSGEPPASPAPALSKTAVTGEDVFTATPQESVAMETAPAPVTPEPVQPPAPTADMDPAEVAQAFYDWYLGFIGDRSSGTFHNPLAEGAYRANPLLSEAFVTRVDALLDSFEGGGYDPFLLAQDIPQDIYAQSAMQTGDLARVTVLRNWGRPQMDAIFAHLRKVDGAASLNDVWLIDDVTPVELYEPTAETPEGAVQMFYSWYTDAVRRRFEDESVDADFHNSALLTEGFKQQIDELKAQAEEEFPEMGLHYDPFLCAQDVPYHVTPDRALIDGQTAALTARTSFPNQVILIDLQLTDAGWRISDITCTVTPEAVTRAFYTWYLGYIGDRGTGDFRNPLAERAYRGHTLLSDALVRRVDAMFDEQGAIGHDPFLLAQDVPSSFSVDPGVEEGTAVVHFHFGPEFTSHALLTMSESGVRWQIEDITPMEPYHGSATEGEVEVMDNEAYGFSVFYPDDWIVQEMALAGPGQPEDWPVVAAWMLMPPEVAEQVAGQSGPPDPNAPIVVAPFNIEVVEGDRDALARVYGELDGQTSLPGVQADFYLQRDPGYAHVVFAHPLREGSWIVFTDWVTEFPGREALGEVAQPAWEMLLRSVQFSE